MKMKIKLDLEWEEGMGDWFLHAKGFGGLVIAFIQGTNEHYYVMMKMKKESPVILCWLGRRKFGSI